MFESCEKLVELLRIKDFSDLLLCHNSDFMPKYNLLVIKIQIIMPPIRLVLEFLWFSLRCFVNSLLHVTDRGDGFIHRVDGRLHLIAALGQL